jgi:hypothetical protein
MSALPYRKEGNLQERKFWLQRMKERAERAQREARE